MQAEASMNAATPSTVSLLRRALPLPLFLAGVALLVYGAIFHIIPVLPKQEQKPVTPAPPPQMISPFGTFGAIAAPSQPPAPTAQPVQEPEPKIVREVTVGGVARNADGKIERTYTGKPLSQCPT